MVTIHNTLKERRIAKSITQETLADAVGVSRQTIIAIEKSNYIPSLLLAMKIAHYFKVRIEELFTLK